MLRRTLLAFIGGLAAALPFMRAPASAASGDYAIVVGLHGEPDQPAPGDKAARVMVRALKQAGYAPGNIITLLNDSATPEAFRAALAEVRSRISPTGTFVHFYGGHGGRGSNSVTTAAEFAAELSTIQCARMGLIIDGCYSGSFVAPLAGPNRVVVGATQPDKFEIAWPHRLTNFAEWFIGDGLVDRRLSLERAYEYTRNLGVQALMDDQYSGEFGL
jgi:hypothetical protein